MKKIKEKFKSLKTSRGGIEVFILGIIVLASLLITGIFNSGKKNSSSIAPISPAPPEASAYLCCDSGDGDSCKTSDTVKFSWRGDEYALLKSGIALSEGTGHLAPAPPPENFTPTNEKIFLNTSDSTANYSRVSGCEQGKDLVGSPTGCVGIPNDEIIYVCKSDCDNPSGKGSFDAYFRTKDDAIPDVIKNCAKPHIQKGGSRGEQEIIISPEDAKSNLQIRTFKIVDKPGTVEVNWLSPYCKPAIYLYPKKETDVHIDINPKGKLTYTDPFYPSNGWDIRAKPNGELVYKNNKYDYLYYEAEIPDSEISKPTEGFVVEKGEIKSLLDAILPDLSLNSKEASQFSEYWTKVLPDSPFYFVGVISKQTLDSIAPLSFSPKPDTIIRATLYFEALDKKINVNKPTLTPIKRQGFTIIEWGGIFKRDIKHNFSCFQ